MRAGALDGRTALVTGSSSGIGRAIALAFAAEGATVECADIRDLPRPEGPEADRDVGTDELIRRRGGTAAFTATDVSDPAQVEALFAAVAGRRERLDVLVNNAGVIVRELVPIQEDRVESFDGIMDVNARGLWLCCRAAVGAMLPQQPRDGIRGKIINVGSISALMAAPDYAGYHASKGAAMSLTYALAAECGPHGITVNALAPGLTRTAMASGVVPEGSAAEAEFRDRVPLRRLARAEDLAGPAVFLASPAADYVTAAMLPVDGGILAV